MKRSAPISRTTPLVNRAPMSRGTTALRRTAFKKRAAKKRAGHDPKYLAACRGEPCYLLMPRVLCWARNTVVPAHRNEGKGMGLKVPDRLTLPACGACHFAYDQGNQHTRAEKRGAFDRGFACWEPVRAAKMARVQ